MGKNNEYKYAFVAKLQHEDSQVGVTFPDLPGCVTVGDDEEDAINMAKEALELHIEGMEEDGDEIPEPSLKKDIECEESEKMTWVLI